MASLTCLTDPVSLIVADASTVINLNATGCAPVIVRALPNPLVVVDAIPAELEEGRHRGRFDAELLKELVASGLVGIVHLEDRMEPHFEELVIGAAAATLDDGEAATIAYAIEHKAIALIDERKANRICAERFPQLRRGSTVDIFAHPNVGQRLGGDSLAEAVFNALHHGRMRVLPHYVQWVVDLIGNERAALCPSLPASARLPVPKW